MPGSSTRRVVAVVLVAIVSVLAAPSAAGAQDDSITFPHADVVLDDRPTYVPNGPGHADFIHRLYAGLLLRPPDDVGWSYWVSLLDTGTTTRGRIVDEFIESEEFRIRFGTEQAAVVRNLYLNTLGRQPDYSAFGWNERRDHAFLSLVFVLEFALRAIFHWKWRTVVPLQFRATPVVTKSTSHQL